MCKVKPHLNFQLKISIGIERRKRHFTSAHLFITQRKYCVPFFSSSIVAFIYMHANSFTTLHTYCDETIHSNQKTGCFQINGYRLLSFLQTQNKILMRAFNILTFYQSTLGNLQGLSSSPCTPPAIHFMKRFQFYNKR